MIQPSIKCFDESRYIIYNMYDVCIIYNVSLTCRYFRIFNLKIYPVKSHRQAEIALTVTFDSPYVCTPIHSFNGQLNILKQYTMYTMLILKTD